MTRAHHLVLLASALAGCGSDLMYVQATPSPFSATCHEATWVDADASELPEQARAVFERETWEFALTANDDKLSLGDRMTVDVGSLVVKELEFASSEDQNCVPTLRLSNEGDGQCVAGPLAAPCWFLWTFEPGSHRTHLTVGNSEGDPMNVDPAFDAQVRDYIKDEWDVDPDDFKPRSFSVGNGLLRPDFTWGLDYWVEKKRSPHSGTVGIVASGPASIIEPND